jgi:hypothetical protein
MRTLAVADSASRDTADRIRARDRRRGARVRNRWTPLLRRVDDELARAGERELRTGAT